MGNSYTELFVNYHLSPEKKKTELYQELGLQARDLRFQHQTSITTRNNIIILQMEVLLYLSLCP